jgi:nicotinamidase-related amidase
VLPTAQIVELWNAADANARNWQPAVKSAGLLRTLGEQIAPEHTAVVLIDIQNDFCDEKGVFPRRGGGIGPITVALPKMAALLGEARKSGSLIVHIHAEYGLRFRNVGAPHGYPGPGQDGICSVLAGAEFDTYDLSFDDVGSEPCLPGTWGEKPTPGFEPLPGEIVIRKHRYNAFLDTRLEAVLRAHGIRTVVLLGVTSNGCVESTARDAAGRDYYVVVASDCVAAKESHAEMHQGTLKTLATYFGQVVPSTAIAQAWADQVVVPMRKSV